jgi:hypothetical protein
LVILLVLVAFVARVDAAPGDAPVSPPAREVKLLTGVATPNGGPADDAAEADESDDDGDDGDTDDAVEAGDTDDDDADDAPGDRREIAGEAEPGPPDTENPDPGDEAGQLALREAEQAPAGITPGDDASAAAAPAGALETYEAWIRQPRLSRWGRLDVSLAWRQLWSEPMYTTTRRSNSVWLVATWRR